MRALTVDQIERMIRDAMAADDWSTVADLEPRLDRLTTPRPTPKLVDAALWYASTGLHVFPLQPKRKIPYRGTRGCLEATSDPAQITAWWQRWPGSNIGIATGHLVDVIDIDGLQGVLWWSEQIGELGDKMPPLLGVVSTPRGGGSHLYVEPTGLRNKAAIAPGVDYRGDGGYVVAPPSYVVVDPEPGKDGYEGPYTWRRVLTTPAEAVAAA